MHTVREFVTTAFGLVGLDWERHVRTDPRYFRPTEVDELRGDASKAARVLGWTPRTRFAELVRIMLEADLRAVGIDVDLRSAGSGRLMPPITSWPGVRVMVTGGGGFLGQVVVRELVASGADQVFVPRSRDHDLRTRAGVLSALEAGRPDLVIHLAAVVGGIGANRAHPGSFFYENAIMGIQLMEEARLAGVARYLTVGTICAYPKFTPVPFREETSGMAIRRRRTRRTGWPRRCSSSSRRPTASEYGFDAIYVIPVNLYGPGDNFDPASSHVIPALIRKVVDAQERGDAEVPVWGTGSASREFLYVDDAARGIVLAAERLRLARSR